MWLLRWLVREVTCVFVSKNCAINSSRPGQLRDVRACPGAQRDIINSAAQAVPVVLAHLHSIESRYFDAIVLPLPLKAVVAHINNAHHFAHGGVAPMWIRTRFVTDLVILTLPRLLQGGSTTDHLIVGLNG